MIQTDSIVAGIKMSMKLLPRELTIVKVVLPMVLVMAGICTLLQIKEVSAGTATLSERIWSTLMLICSMTVILTAKREEPVSPWLQCLCLSLTDSLDLTHSLCSAEPGSTHAESALSTSPFSCASSSSRSRLPSLSSYSLLTLTCAWDRSSRQCHPCTGLWLMKLLLHHLCGSSPSSLCAASLAAECAPLSSLNKPFE